MSTVNAFPYSSRLHIRGGPPPRTPTTDTPSTALTTSTSPAPPSLPSPPIWAWDGKDIKDLNSEKVVKMIAVFLAYALVQHGIAVTVEQLVKKAVANFSNSVTGGTGLPVALTAYLIGANVSPQIAEKIVQETMAFLQLQLVGSSYKIGDLGSKGVRVFAEDLSRRIQEWMSKMKRELEEGGPTGRVRHPLEFLADIE
ncbi:hypothetical protein HK102_007023 [Quaeritorhiza haematococci]|nr:hypothetical protein HK102_007023 [Quaeritorhiza haematococci]